MHITRSKILGVNLALTDYAGLLETVMSAISRQEHIRLNFCNVHVTMMSRKSPALLAALNHPQALTLPDGMPLAWTLRSWGEDIKDRVYGPDFFELCLSETQHQVKHFFYGSTVETLEKLRENMTARFPGIQIAGMYSPPFRQLTPEEETDILNMINDSGADIVWVGLGAPKQELWTDCVAAKLTAPVVAAVGAAFDFHAGTVAQAPDWMQNHGLEWLYRLAKEPRRLWFRYCYYNPLFILSFIWERYIKRKR
jgi:N-acetylglucosaminyldiphosphoundecaprenol N-acetyl-beta-D-mannosaminyltransferase